MGCSKTAVSLAMRGSPQISTPVRKLILKTAEELEYIPHFAAKQLSVGKSGLIGVYLSGMSHDDVWTSVAEELLRKLNDNKYKPILGVNGGNANNNNTIPENSWLQTFAQLSVEALIVIAYKIEDVEIPRRLTCKSPLFIGVSPPERNCEYNYIALDRANAAKIAIEHLLSKGRKNIAIVNYESRMTPDALDFAISHGAKAQCYDIGVYHGVKDRVNIATHLADNIASKSIKPDACFLGDSATAAIFVNCLITRGIKVPDDIAVIGYDYAPMADMAIVPLTTVEQPIEIIVNETVDSIFSILKDEKKQVKRQKTIQHRLVVRKST